MVPDLEKLEDKTIQDQYSMMGTRLDLYSMMYFPARTVLGRINWGRNIVGTE